MMRFLAASLLCCTGTAWSANLLTNPGFEAGLSGWTVAGGSHGVDVAGTAIPGSDFGSTVAVKSGTYAAWGLVRGACCTTPESVTFAQTVAVAPGKDYLVGFFINNHSDRAVGYGTGDDPSRIQIFVNGLGLLPSVEPCPGSVCLEPGLGWFGFEHSVNSGASTSLTVEYRIIASGTGYVGLSADDFYVVGAPIPEPGTYALMALGLLSLGFAVRRRS